MLKFVIIDGNLRERRKLSVLYRSLGGAMTITPEGVAFATLIGGQFAAVIAMTAVKRRFYLNENGDVPPRSTKAELDRFHPARPLGQWLIES